MTIAMRRHGADSAALQSAPQRTRGWHDRVLLIGSIDVIDVIVVECLWLFVLVSDVLQYHDFVATYSDSV